MHTYSKNYICNSVTKDIRYNVSEICLELFFSRVSVLKDACLCGTLASMKNEVEWLVLYSTVRDEGTLL